MPKKYVVNQIILVTSLLISWGFFIWVFTSKPPLQLLVLTILPSAFVLHYQYNAVHQASHRQLSRYRWFNSFLGNLASILTGTTLISFASNHLLHHRNPTDPESDPDHEISAKSNLFMIAFKIWYHDYYFLKNRLWKHSTEFLTYLCIRILQLLMIIFLILNGNLIWFLGFWSLPVWLLGTLNGLFLFYFPHYSTKKVDFWKTRKNNSLPIKIFLLLVYISRKYHTAHHRAVSKNTNYFPVFSLFNEKLSLIKIKLSKDV